MDATASKRTIQKTAEATGDLIGNKIADKITSVSKRFLAELPSKNVANTEIEVAKKKKRYISTRKATNYR